MQIAPIQLLLILGGLVIFLIILRTRSLLLHRAAGLLLFIAIVVAAIFPNLTTVLAELVGVGRGADLILYLSFLMFTYVGLIAFSRIRKLQRDVTTLTRAFAHDRAVAPEVVTAPEN